MRLIAVIALSAVLAGCAWPTRTELVCPDVPTIVRPALPAISAEDLACMTDDAYRRLLDRDRLRREYAEEQEVVLHQIRTKCEEMKE